MTAANTNNEIQISALYVDRWMVGSASVGIAFPTPSQAYF